MFCRQCGSDNDSAALFCKKCGTRVSGTPAVPASLENSSPYRTPNAELEEYAEGGYFEPEQVNHAGFWMRAAAFLLDALLIGVPVSILMSASPERQNLAAPAMFLIVFAPMIYFITMESSVHQGTLGKKLLGIKVVNDEGERLSMSHATGRFFSRVITCFIPFHLGWIMAGFTKNKQAMHDVIAKTYVIRT